MESVQLLEKEVVMHFPDQPGRDGEMQPPYPFNPTLGMVHMSTGLEEPPLQRNRLSPEWSHT